MIPHRVFFMPLLATCLALSLSAQAKPRTPEKQKSSATMPITTSSAKARHLFEQAMVDFGNLHVERALQGWRAATKADPNFAMAHILLVFSSRNPAEERAARLRAKALMSHVTPGERLLIRWLAGVKEDDYMTGIAAMNDLVAMYPRDRMVLFLAGDWLLFQHSYEPAEKILQQAYALDPAYPPVLNDLGYLYAFTQDFDRAVPFMEQYVKALPGEPNPNDSYAEVLRLSGRYEAALEHYRAALKIDPKFAYSMVGIADTYTLMGNQKRARVEYAKAVTGAQNESDALEFSMQAAMTHVREKKFADADAAFASVAARAEQSGFFLHVAQIQRMMAMYQTDDAAALGHLDQAEAVLAKNSSISRSALDEEAARILRYRVARTVRLRPEIAAAALQRLETMAASSRSSVVQHCYHAAVGASLMAAGRYADAIPHLEEDSEDPVSMKLLVTAYHQARDPKGEHAVGARLAKTHTPTIEHALLSISSDAALGRAAGQQ